MSRDCVISLAAVPWLCAGSPKSTISLFLGSAAYFFLRTLSMKLCVSLKRFSKGVEASDEPISNSGLPVQESRKSSSPESFPTCVEASEAAWSHVSVLAVTASAGVGTRSTGVAGFGGVGLTCRIVLRHLSLFSCSTQSLVLGIWPPPVSLFLDLEWPRA